MMHSSCLGLIFALTLYYFPKFTTTPLDHLSRDAVATKHLFTAKPPNPPRNHAKFATALGSAPSPLLQFQPPGVIYYKTE